MNYNSRIRYLGTFNLLHVTTDARWLKKNLGLVLLVMNFLRGPTHVWFRQLRKRTFNKQCYDLRKNARGTTWIQTSNRAPPRPPVEKRFVAVTNVPLSLTQEVSAATSTYCAVVLMLATDPWSAVTKNRNHRTDSRNGVKIKTKDSDFFWTTQIGHWLYRWILWMMQKRHYSVYIIHFYLLLLERKHEERDRRRVEEVE